ncbi:MAG: glycosyltransferase, partial [Candidatus Omnitrophica bacterium]|nr:glycosyltransferase [Candidatus Omnitrophota bacterium]
SNYLIKNPAALFHEIAHAYLDAHNDSSYELQQIEQLLPAQRKAWISRWLNVAHSSLKAHYLIRELQGLISGEQNLRLSELIENIKRLKQTRESGELFYLGDNYLRLRKLFRILDAVERITGLRLLIDIGEYGRSHLKENILDIVIRDEGGREIAKATIYPIKHADETYYKEAVFLEWITIVPLSLRGNGIGSVLYKALAELLKGLGYKYIYGCPRDNTEKFWLRQGWSLSEDKIFASGSKLAYYIEPTKEPCTARTSLYRGELSKNRRLKRAHGPLGLPNKESPEQKDKPIDKVYERIGDLIIPASRRDTNNKDPPLNISNIRIKHRIEQIQNSGSKKYDTFEEIEKAILVGELTRPITDKNIAKTYLFSSKHNNPPYLTKETLELLEKLSLEFQRRLEKEGLSITAKDKDGIERFIFLLITSAIRPKEAQDKLIERVKNGDELNVPIIAKNSMHTTGNAFDIGKAWFINNGYLKYIEILRKLLEEYEKRGELVWYDENSVIHVARNPNFEANRTVYFGCGFNPIAALLGLINKNWVKDGGYSVNCQRLWQDIRALKSRLLRRQNQIRAPDKIKRETTSGKDYVIITPVYNEGEELEGILKKVEELGYLDRVIFVDDGSTDNITVQILKAWKARGKIKVIYCPQNGRKIGAIRTALHCLEKENKLPENIVLTDADTFLEPVEGYNSVKEAIQAVVDYKDSCGFVGLALPLRPAQKGILSKIQALEYSNSMMLRRLLGWRGQAIVIPGACSVYSTKEYMELMDGVIIDRDFPEDIHMTYLLQAQGYRVGYYNKSLRAITSAPFTIKVFVKQRMRWSRSFWKILWLERSFALKRVLNLNLMGVFILLEIASISTLLYLIGATAVAVFGGSNILIPSLSAIFIPAGLLSILGILNSETKDMLAMKMGIAPLELVYRICFFYVISSGLIYQFTKHLIKHLNIWGERTIALAWAQREGLPQPTFQRVRDKFERAEDKLKKAQDESYKRRPDEMIENYCHWAEEKVKGAKAKINMIRRNSKQADAARTDRPLTPEAAQELEKILYQHTREALDAIGRQEYLGEQEVTIRLLEQKGYQDIANRLKGAVVIHAPPALQWAIRKFELRYKVRVFAANLPAEDIILIFKTAGLKKSLVHEASALARNSDEFNRRLENEVDQPVTSRKAHGTGHNRVNEVVIGSAVIVKIASDLLEVWCCFGRHNSPRAEMNLRSEIAILSDLTQREAIVANKKLKEALDKIIVATEKPYQDRYYNSMYWMHVLKEQGEIDEEQHNALLNLYENRFIISEEEVKREIEELRDAVNWILWQNKGNSSEMKITRKLVKFFAVDIERELSSKDTNKFAASYILYKKIEQWRRHIPEQILSSGCNNLDDPKHKASIGSFDSYLVAVEMMEVLRHRRYFGIKGTLEHKKKKMQDDELRRLELAFNKLKVKTDVPQEWVRLKDLIEEFIGKENCQIGFATWKAINRLGGILKLKRTQFLTLKEFASKILLAIDTEFVSNATALGDDVPVVLVIFGNITPSQLKKLIQRYNVVGGLCNFGSTIGHLGEGLNNNGIPGILGIPIEFMEEIKEGDRVALIPYEVINGNLVENRVIHNPTIEEYGFILAKMADEESAKILYNEQNPPVQIKFNNGSILSIALAADDIFEMKGGKQKIGGADAVFSVGLVRSELDEVWEGEKLPALHELADIYVSMAEASYDKLIIIRTLDRQEDKKIGLYFSLPFDDAHTGFNFYRTRKGRTLVLLQIEALILAYNEIKNIGVLFPHISDSEDVEYAFNLIKKAKDILQDQGLVGQEFNLEGFVIRFMVENIRAVDNIKDIVKAADINIGTNDLIMSVLSINRDDPSVGKELEGINSSVVRRIIYVDKRAAQQQRAVCVCGSLASEPRLWTLAAYMAKLIPGLNISLAVSFACVPRAKYFLNKLAVLVENKPIPESLQRLFDSDQSLPKAEELNQDASVLIKRIEEDVENSPEYLRIRREVEEKYLERFGFQQASSDYASEGATREEAEKERLRLLNIDYRSVMPLLATYSFAVESSPATAGVVNTPAPLFINIAYIILAIAGIFSFGFVSVLVEDYISQYSQPSYLYNRIRELADQTKQAAGANQQRLANKLLHKAERIGTKLRRVKDDLKRAGKTGGYVENYCYCAEKRIKEAKAKIDEIGRKEAAQAPPAKGSTTVEMIVASVGFTGLVALGTGLVLGLPVLAGLGVIGVGSSVILAVLNGRVYGGGAVPAEREQKQLWQILKQLKSPIKFRTFQSPLFSLGQRIIPKTIEVAIVTTITILIIGLKLIKSAATKAANKIFPQSRKVREIALSFPGENLIDKLLPYFFTPVKGNLTQREKEIEEAKAKIDEIGRKEAAQAPPAKGIVIKTLSFVLLIPLLSLNMLLGFFSARAFARSTPAVVQCRSLRVNRKAPYKERVNATQKILEEIVDALYPQKLQQWRRKLARFVAIIVNHESDYLTRKIPYLYCGRRGDERGLAQMRPGRAKDTLRLHKNDQLLRNFIEESTGYSYDKILAMDKAGLSNLLVENDIFDLALATIHVVDELNGKPIPQTLEQKASWWARHYNGVRKYTKKGTVRKIWKGRVTSFKGHTRKILPLLKSILIILVAASILFANNSPLLAAEIVNNSQATNFLGDVAKDNLPYIIIGGIGLIALVIAGVRHWITKRREAQAPERYGKVIELTEEAITKESRLDKAKEILRRAEKIAKKIPSHTPHYKWAQDAIDKAQTDIEGAENLEFQTSEYCSWIKKLSIKAKRNKTIYDYPELFRNPPNGNNHHFQKLLQYRRGIWGVFPFLPLSMSTPGVCTGWVLFA